MSPLVTMALWSNVAIYLSAKLQFGRLSTLPTVKQGENKDVEDTSEIKVALDTFTLIVVFALRFSRFSRHIATKAVTQIKRAKFLGESQQYMPPVTVGFSIK